MSRQVAVVLPVIRSESASWVKAWHLNADQTPCSLSTPDLRSSSLSWLSASNLGGARRAGVYLVADAMSLSSNHHVPALTAG